MPTGLGTPVVPFSPFYVGVSFSKKGTRIIEGLLGNLERVPGNLTEGALGLGCRISASRCPHQALGFRDAIEVNQIV